MKIDLLDEIFFRTGQLGRGQAEFVGEWTSSIIFERGPDTFRTNSHTLGLNWYYMLQEAFQSNRKSLSRRATWRIKFIIIPTISAIVLMLYISFVTSLWGEPEALAFGSLIALAILFVLFTMTRRMHFVEYDDQFVYVKKYGKEKKFPLHTVQGVYLPSNARQDRTYQLEVKQPGGNTKTFSFLGDLTNPTIWGRPKDPESIKEFMEMVKQVKEPR